MRKKFINWNATNLYKIHNNEATSQEDINFIIVSKFENYCQVLDPKGEIFFNKTKENYLLLIFIQ